jgi:hypothetical protein
VSYEIGKTETGNAGGSVVEGKPIKFGIGPCEEISSEFGTVVSDSITGTCSVEGVFDSAIEIDCVPRTPLDLPDSVVSTPSVTSGPFVSPSLTATLTVPEGTPVLISNTFPNSVEYERPSDVSDSKLAVMSSVVGLAAGCSLIIPCCVDSGSLISLVDVSVIVDVMMVDGSETYPFESSSLSEVGVWVVTVSVDGASCAETSCSLVVPPLKYSVCAATRTIHVSTANSTEHFFCNRQKK